jgi:hypothetical protein
MLMIHAMEENPDKNWQVTYNAAKQQYIGVQERYPEEHGAFKFYTIYASYENGRHDGWDCNDNADGNFRAFGQKASQHYYQLFKKIHEQKK